MCNWMAVRGVVLSALLSFGAAEAVEQPQSPTTVPSPTAASGPLQTAAPPAQPSAAASDLGKLTERTKKLEDELDLYKQWLQWGSAILAFVFAIASFFGWQAIRDLIRRVVERNLDAQLKTTLAQMLPDRLADAQAKAETYLLRFAKLQTLHGIRHFDEALKAYSWTGNVADLRNESPSIRRLIIECLHSCREDRKVNRQHAWEALGELLNDDVGLETRRLYLRISYASRRIREGVSFVDKYLTDLRTDRESALRASTLLRKANRQEDALALVKGVYDENDLECVVHSAVLQRDLGNFDGAHDALTPSVAALVSDPKTTLPEGWHRLLNTYVANCLDRGRPQDGVTSAEFVFRSSPGAVEVFTVGRLLRELPTTNPARAQLLDRFSAAIDGLAPGEAKLRCEVLRHQLNGRMDQAERMLKQSIQPEAQGSRQVMDNDLYFQHCTLGEFYIDQKRADDAIDVLMPAAGATFGGEAKFYLAIAYALKGENRDSARWLTQALQELPKWAAHARDHGALRGVAEVAEVLATYTRGRQQ